MRVAQIMLIIWVGLLLSSCSEKEEENLLSLSEDVIELYIIYDEKDESDQNINQHELLQHISKYKIRQQIPVTTMSWPKEKLEKYQITELPVFIMADEKEILLKTNNIAEVKDYISGLSDK
ncbi:hypothetical protein [Sporosarcina cyprini]|uniref:hypothetical protein n=1 Tax=Sporosarcina cyprini TaxID=2910523 RepID=UPI001EE14BB5|nr:hypothetical protein [Sporosarcina cyprini]MCG3087135.1 hypothetical protein [Sporosarcina cyprini]